MRRTANAEFRRGLRQASHGELVRLCGEGDETAWNELVRRFDSGLHGAAYRSGVAPSDIADVVQATWLRLIEHIHEIRDPERIPAWLVTTMRREGLTRSRVASRVVPSADLELTAGVEGSDEGLGDRLDAGTKKALATAMGRLRARDQELIWLLTEGSAWSYTDVAQRVGMPVGSVGPTRQRCLAKLRRMPGLAVAS